MATRLKKQAPALCMLCYAKPKMRKAVIESADKDLIHCLCECALNILKGNVTLTKDQLKQLSRYKQHLRQLTEKKLALKKKKEIIQKGGFLPALLAPLAASVIAPLLKHV